MTRSSSAVTDSTENRSPKSPPWPGAGPSASTARVSALVRAWSALSNASTTRTSPPGWTDIAKPVTGLTSPASAISWSACSSSLGSAWLIASAEQV